MKRRVEERERRTLASSVERRALREPRAPFHVAGRQRAQRARDFGKCEVGKIALFRRAQPGGELRRVARRACTRHARSVLQPSTLPVVAGEPGNDTALFVYGAASPLCAVKGTGTCATYGCRYPRVGQTRHRV